MVKKEKIKHSKEHILAVEERLCEYIHAIESDIYELESCVICYSLSEEVHTCENCLLNMHQTGNRCYTMLRKKLIVDYYGRGNKMYTKCDKRYLKLRYKELCKHLNVKE